MAHVTYLRTKETSEQSKDHGAPSRGRGTHNLHGNRWISTFDQFSRFYQYASIVVVPSRAPETFGLVGVEAMAHAKPVISSQVGGTADWLRHGKNGLSFRSGDVLSLAGAIQTLISHSALAQKMGQKGYQMWQQEFRLKAHVDGLLLVMHELLYKKLVMPMEVAQ